MKSVCLNKTVEFSTFRTCLKIKFTYAGVLGASLVVLGDFERRALFKLERLTFA